MGVGTGGGVEAWTVRKRRREGVSLKFRNLTETAEQAWWTSRGALLLVMSQSDPGLSINPELFRKSDMSSSGCFCLQLKN